MRTTTKRGHIQCLTKKKDKRGETEKSRGGKKVVLQQKKKQKRLSPGKKTSHSKTHTKKAKRK